MDKREVINTIYDLIPYLLSAFQVHKVILYGSWIEGNQDLNSDIDIAVIVHEVPHDYLQCLIKIHEICSAVNVRLEPVLFEYGHDQSGFLEHILSQGEVLFDEGQLISDV